MEEKNSVWGYILVAVVTIVIGVGIGLAISYFTKEDKEPNVIVDNDSNWEEENNGQTNTEEQEEKEIKDWTEYLLNQEIKEMYIRVHVDDGVGHDYFENINITKEELSNIFSEMKKGKLTKKSAGGVLGNIEIKIEYMINDKEYSLSIGDGKYVWFGEDATAIKLIEKENYVTDPNFEINLDTYYEYDWNGIEYLNKLIENR